ncbi:PadR family transcriptional regulator [Kitasatospora herbaricolor]|uniref:PadR family transcriptional regulator n=1 Tax=Kitasatospora herbaricolor TaxID=68217 RepID=UPI0017490E79|nr:PadR family transcriptional regulator [Kitasatospora herbaricolor]MDQ0311128.1 DNA-binding PadR family transcriptional regulator [Kitasatospora herbaricolor]GGV11842.1 PadR family transcriptional regulator [Kitasatospora herbaricolor]
MAKRRKVGNPLALAVLAELVAEPMHPYEMGRRLKEHGKDRDIKYTRSSLYMVVEQLRKAGFVAEQETVRDTQRPERTVFALTEDGRRELDDWMRELVAEPQHEYPLFGVALSLLAVLPPAEAVDLLARRLDALTAQVEEIRARVATATEQGVPWIFLIEDEYRRGVQEAEQRFVAGLIVSLKEPEYLRTWQQFFGSRT